MRNSIAVALASAGIIGAGAAVAAFLPINTSSNDAPLCTTVVASPYQHCVVPPKRPTIGARLHSVVERIAALISSNEGKLTTIDWNDNGHGVSVGMFQANQKVGQLPEMLHKMTCDPHGRNTMCAIFGPQLASTIQKDPAVVQKLKFTPKSPLGNNLRRLVYMKDFQQLQVRMLHQKVLKAATIARQNGIKSTAGVALYADLTNQWGENGAQSFLRYADRYKSEGAKIKALVQAVNSCSKYGARYKDDLKKAECFGLNCNVAFPEDLGS